MYSKYISAKKQTNKLGHEFPVSDSNINYNPISRQHLRRCEIKHLKSLAV